MGFQPVRCSGVKLSRLDNANDEAVPDFSTRMLTQAAVLSFPSVSAVMAKQILAGQYEITNEGVKREARLE